MAIDFCNTTQLDAFIQLFNQERDLDIVPIYTYLCPVLIFVCFCSVMFNAILISISRQSKAINKSPVLLLSLNLALTDLIASLMNGLSILLNSYLPEVYELKMSQCNLLMMEIVRCAALAASALHLLVLALVLYRGIVNPLHYRSTIFFSQHLSRTVNIISIICWLIPLAIVVPWFTHNPCQGFQTPECSYFFLLKFNYRYMELTLFALPLLLMLIIYLRIFIIISQHQKGRRMNHERSATLSRGVITASEPIGTTAAALNLGQLMAAQSLVDDNANNINDAPAAAARCAHCSRTNQVSAEINGQLNDNDHREASISTLSEQSDGRERLLAAPDYSPAPLVCDTGDGKNQHVGSHQHVDAHGNRSASAGATAGVGAPPASRPGAGELAGELAGDASASRLANKSTIRQTMCALAEAPGQWPAPERHSSDTGAGQTGRRRARQSSQSGAPQTDVASPSAAALGGAQGDRDGNGDGDGDVGVRGDGDGDGDGRPGLEAEVEVEVEGERATAAHPDRVQAKLARLAGPNFARSSTLSQCTCDNKSNASQGFGGKLGRANGEHRAGAASAALAMGCKQTLVKVPANGPSQPAASQAQRQLISPGTANSVAGAPPGGSGGPKLRRTATVVEPSGRHLPADRLLKPTGSLGVSTPGRPAASGRKLHATASQSSCSQNQTSGPAYEPQRRHVHASAGPQTSTKALMTTLLILGTYFTSYAPTIIFRVLSCVDYCPYPLYDIPFSRRVLYGAVSTLLLIVKSIIDPLIYSYRTNEIQQAVSRYLSKRRSKSSMAVSMAQSSQRLHSAAANHSNWPSTRNASQYSQQFGYNQKRANHSNHNPNNGQQSNSNLKQNSNHTTTATTTPTTTVAALNRSAEHSYSASPLHHNQQTSSALLEPKKTITSTATNNQSSCSSGTGGSASGSTGGSSSGGSSGSLAGASSAAIQLGQASSAEDQQGSSKILTNSPLTVNTSMSRKGRPRRRGSRTNSTATRPASPVEATGDRLNQQPPVGQQDGDAGRGVTGASTTPIPQLHNQARQTKTAGEHSLSSAARDLSPDLEQNEQALADRLAGAQPSSASQPNQLEPSSAPLRANKQPLGLANDDTLQSEGMDERASLLGLQRVQGGS